MELSLFQRNKGRRKGLNFENEFIQLFVHCERLKLTNQIGLDANLITLVDPELPI